MKITWSDQHKYKALCNGGYHFVVYCEYCGRIAWDGNHTELSLKEHQGKAEEPCPRTPTAVNQPVKDER